VTPAGRLAVAARFEGRVRNLATMLLPPEEKPWRTVRDALVDVPDPRRRDARDFLNHNFQGGAKAYPGHTGSPLDLPAKTLNMMVLPTGDVRYFSARESARLQTFPDGFVFHGSWTETMRQLGNAVPVALGRRVAASVAERLAESEIRKIVRARGRNVA
jgi:DNA (cytosine-5)-methyltransferase 1